MRLSKKLLSFIVLLSLVMFLITGCGEDSSGKVFYLNHDGNDLVGGQLIRDASLKAAQSAGFDVEVLDAKGDSNLQMDQMKEAIKNNPLAIVLVAINGDSIIPFVEQANEANIPIITVNRGVNGGKVNKVYCDEYEAGKLQADYLLKTLPQGANVVYLEGESNNSGAQQRWEGFKKECLEKRSDITLLDMQDGKWGKAEAMKIVSLWLSLFPKIDAVVCGNDQMALGAIIALKKANRLAGCQVSGVDAVDEALKAIKAGEMVQTIKQDIDKQGEAVASILTTIKQGSNPSDIQVPYSSITKENIK